MHHFQYHSKKKCLRKRLQKQQTFTEKCFPKLGKHEKRKKMVIPTLENMKNSENQLSYVWENRKMPQAAFPTPRKNGKC